MYQFNYIKKIFLYSTDLELIFNFYFYIPIPVTGESLLGWGKVTDPKSDLGGDPRRVGVPVDWWSTCFTGVRTGSGGNGGKLQNLHLFVPLSAFFFIGLEDSSLIKKNQGKKTDKKKIWKIEKCLHVSKI